MVQKKKEKEKNIWYRRRRKNKIMIGIPMYIASYEKMYVSMVEVAEVPQVFFVGGRILHVLKHFSQVTWG